MKHRLSRRDFLKLSALSSTGLVLANSPFRLLAQDVVNLELVGWGSTTEIEARELTLGLFNSEFSDIQVEFTHTPSSDYQTVLQTRLAGGDYPDIIFLGNGDIETYVARNQLLALDEYIESDGLNHRSIYSNGLFYLFR